MFKINKAHLLHGGQKHLLIVDGHITGSFEGKGRSIRDLA